MTGMFHPLCVAGLRPETEAAKSIVFDVPDAHTETFRWRAGQHLILRFHVDGAETRRTYSISTAPCSGEPLRITVKRVRDGLVSNYINDALNVGDMIDVAPPFGGFCLDPDDRARRTHYFFGAGSGITPLFAMIEAVLLAEPQSAAHLVYGNRGADCIIFRDALAELERSFPARLTVRHVLSSPSLWSSFDYWRKGIVDTGAVGAVIEEQPPYAQDTQYHICGPGSMNADVMAALQGLDVPTERIHRESYGGAVAQDDTVEGVAASAKVSLGGTDLKIAVGKGESILSALRAAGQAPPYSCEAGVCGACRAELLEGAVHMRARMALDDAEVAGGAILTCQSIPTSDRLVLRYDA